MYLKYNIILACARRLGNSVANNLFQVTDVNGRSVLNQGWPEYAIAHKLKSRYFLIFKKVVHQSSQHSSLTILVVR
jgi:hypothetical protein